MKIRKITALCFLMVVGLLFPCLSRADQALSLTSSTCTQNGFTATLYGTWRNATTTCHTSGEYPFLNYTCAAPDAATKIDCRPQNNCCGTYTARLFNPRFANDACTQMLTAPYATTRVCDHGN